MIINELPLAWLPLADAVVKASLILLAAALASLSCAARRRPCATWSGRWRCAARCSCRSCLSRCRSGSCQLVTIAVDRSGGREHGRGRQRLNLPPQRRSPQRRASVAPADADAGAAAPAGVRARHGCHRMSWQAALLAIWLLGAAAILGRIAVGLVAVRFLSRRTQLITDAEWLPMAMASPRRWA